MGRESWVEVEGGWVNNVKSWKGLRYRVKRRIQLGGGVVVGIMVEVEMEQRMGDIVSQALVVFPPS